MLLCTGLYVLSIVKGLSLLLFANFLFLLQSLSFSVVQGSQSPIRSGFWRAPSVAKALL